MPTATCRVGSNTHVMISMYVCACTCMSTTRHVNNKTCVLGPTPYVIISMYVCSYMHIDNTTCRAAFNTTCCNQHVWSFVHSCQQHDMSCRVQHHTSTTRQVILSTHALTKKDDLHLSSQNAMPLSMLQLITSCDLSTWSIVRRIDLVDDVTYQTGRRDDPRTW
jgi:hypothetical protein